LATERCRVLETEMVNCHQLEQRLNRQLKKLDEAGKGDGRRIFTRRIFEVVANVRKQEEEIGRVLESTRLLQKEIAQLTGNLDRTFTAVEERLYRDAQRDLTLQKAYKILLRIHEECRLLTSAVEASGALVRETDEVVDQTETETLLRGGDAQLELLLADLAQTRQSNIQLSMLMTTV